ncbi:MAG: M14 family metallopeptidase [bacterium]|nr:M14 family metallopeptidase [bacterium]
MNFLSATLRLCGLVSFLAFAVVAQIPAPKDTLGFTPGDDRKLASWAQVVDYFKKLDAASDRMVFEEIGKTTMGAPFVYATVSSPENLKNIEKYKAINAELADPRKLGEYRGLPADRAKAHIAQGKTIVLITFGIHSTEVGSTLSSMLIAHELASSSDARIKNILDNTIILLVPSLNPDGVDIVKNWYDKTLGTPYEGTNPPELYHKYVGHDNNRDWYAFTQVETQLTVDKIHNVWHPQIVLDVHQQGPNGARQFLPPYMAPVEPNVPKQIVEGFTELGNYMAGDLRKKGLQGITTNTTYDAWTPARAYSHYHGGVRILSETASAKLATPITVKFEDLRGASGGLDAKKESPNFGPVWKGGEWKLRNITDYMHATAFSLLDHAADNREKWLSRFYEIGKEAVRPKKSGEASALVIDANLRDGKNAYKLKEILERGGVKVEFGNRISSGAKVREGRAFLVKLDQPYSGFAKALLETQSYPNLLDKENHPIAPYDVTAHTLPLLFGIKVETLSGPVNAQWVDVREGNGLSTAGYATVIGLYGSFNASMDEGWTRWVLEQDKRQHKRLTNRDLQDPLIADVSALDSIVFPDQSAAQILNGHRKGSMPDEYTGGVGKEGVENLKKFVEVGGTLVFLNESSNFAIEQFNLPVKNITKGLNRKDFYIPGSILRTELDLSHPIAKGMPQQSIAWFENSPVFEIQTDPLAAGVGRPTGWVGAPSTSGALANARATDTAGLTRNFRIIASYPKDPKQILLSGWALGAEKLAGKAALVEFTVGKGKIVLFGFRPQYRGQSLATLPLLFNAISQ